MTGAAGRQDPVRFRAMMSLFPTGVSVVTAVDQDGRPWGMTCSSLCSVTVEPPTLLICLRAASPTLAALTASGAFTVNLLSATAQSCAQLFASGAADRFERVSWSAGGGTGPHLYDSSVAIADCAVRDTQLVGTHVVVLGEVLDVDERQDQVPLLYGRREYATWPGSVLAAGGEG